MRTGSGVCKASTLGRSYSRGLPSHAPRALIEYFPYFKRNKISVVKSKDIISCRTKLYILTLRAVTHTHAWYGKVQMGLNLIIAHLLSREGGKDAPEEGSVSGYIYIYITEPWRHENQRCD